MRLAAAKVAAGARALRDDGIAALVLAADTTVALDGAILGKPRDGTEALAMLRRLAGRTQEAVEALGQALACYERKGNIVMSERTRTRLAAFRHAAPR